MLYYAKLLDLLLRNGDDYFDMVDWIKDRFIRWRYPHRALIRDETLHDIIGIMDWLSENVDPLRYRIDFSIEREALHTKSTNTNVAYGQVMFRDLETAINFRLIFGDKLIG